jgi:hypothetical protein
VTVTWTGMKTTTTMSEAVADLEHVRRPHLPVTQLEEGDEKTSTPSELFVAVAAFSAAPTGAFPVSEKEKLALQQAGSRPRKL